MSFAPEPAFAHGTAADAPPSLLCNLGTPDAPTPAAVRRYLAEFLSDPRVVEIPRLLWWPILHGVDPAHAAGASRRASTPASGRPKARRCKVWTEKQAKLLGGYLGERGHRGRSCATRCATAARRSPAVLDELKAAGRDADAGPAALPAVRGTTTASVSDARRAPGCSSVRNLPELRFVKHYHDDPGYIDALAQRVDRALARHTAGPTSSC